MKIIPLTKGKVTIVDDEDYIFLNQWKWFVKKSGNKYYAARSSRKKESKQRIVIYMHKVILNIPNNSKLEGDHENRDSLDNQRSNLRRATRSQNVINRIQKNTTGYRGVYYHIGRKKFVAQININCKQTYLGLFDDPIKAAEKYDRYALKYHGEFAVLNFKQ